MKEVDVPGGRHSLVCEILVYTKRVTEGIYIKRLNPEEASYSLTSLQSDYFATIKFSTCWPLLWTYISLSRPVHLLYAAYTDL